LLASAIAGVEVVGAAEAELFELAELVELVEIAELAAPAAMVVGEAPVYSRTGAEDRAHRAHSHDSGVHRASEG
jgi:hypothetical protein